MSVPPYQRVAKRSTVLGGALALAALTACAAGERSSGAMGEVTRDTLPGGIASVNSSGPTAWTDTTGWRLVADGWLEGDVGSAGEFVNPRDMAIDERGFVYVADQKPEVIKVFDDKGKHVRTIGRTGEGPGEFLVALHAVRSGRIIVHDPQVARVSVFDTSGTYLKSWPGTCCYWYRPYIDTQGRITIPAAPPDGATRAFLRFDTAGTFLDTLRVPKAGDEQLWVFRNGTSVMMSTPVSFTPRSDVDLGPDGQVIHGWSGAYRFARSDNGRDTSLVFGRDWTPEPLTAALRDATYDDRIAGLAKAMSIEDVTIRAQFDKGKIPATLPAFSGISLDGLGNSWVHLSEDSTKTRFDVFDAEGVYLGPVEVPALVKKRDAAFGRDVMYLRTESEEGYPRIVRYRIVKDRRADP